MPKRSYTRRNGAGAHQLASPARRMNAGTSVARMIVASMTTASAFRRPSANGNVTSKASSTRVGRTVRLTEAGRVLARHAPAVTTAKWLERWRFMDKAGDRWWPFFGGTYMLQGIKRVQGMRLITPNWRDRRATAKRLSPVAQRRRQVPGGVQKTK